MPLPSHTLVVELLPPGDPLALAQAIVIDGDAFPAPSDALGSDPFERVFIVRMPAEARVVGFASARWHTREVYIERFAVDRDCRRQGFGRHLLQGLVAEAQRAGAKTIALHVSVANQAAVALYGAGGFLVQKRVPTFYRAGLFDAEGAAFEMRRVLDSLP
jgi:ribosomal protein S18 acetylase RimI-like enzyme